ncbi:hypothetical protein HU200_034685 [Digitaria exilis]|uniref:Uncharacterized protein n=1 Tax=Digitaria exilis TaxID=1010633 RepID=A0A835BJ09_9POAL|nr:hypothetical protein HU200_034685 [Digitaria exilis]
MRDLLSRPLDRLSGPPLEALLEVFDQFDLTLSETSAAIQASINNIVRAPCQLAEKFRTVIDLVAAQTSADPNIIGESSRTHSCGDEEDFVDAPTGKTQCCILIALDTIL